MSSEQDYDTILVKDWDYSGHIPSTSKEKILDNVLFLGYVRKIFCTGHYMFKATIYDVVNSKESHVEMYISRDYFDALGIAKGEETSNELKRLSLCSWRSLPVRTDNDEARMYVDHQSYKFRIPEDGSPTIKTNEKVEWTNPGCSTMTKDLSQIMIRYSIPCTKYTYILNECCNVAKTLTLRVIIKPEVCLLDPQIPGEVYDKLVSAQGMTFTQQIPFEKDGTSQKNPSKRPAEAVNSCDTKRLKREQEAESSVNNAIDSIHDEEFIYGI